MKKTGTGKSNKKASRLDFLFRRRSRSKAVLIIPILLYILLYFCTVISARSGVILNFGESTLPMSAFAGVFSSLSNICLVVMVLFHKKVGFIVSIVIIVLQLPILLIQIFVKNGLSSIPGLFSEVFTVVMIVIIYLNQSKLEKEQQRMRDLFVQTATALVNAIDAKDTYTHGHSSRVAEYSRRLAEMNNKSINECDEIYYTALLHDVGKIGVPSSIINKAGKLTKEEYEIVKQHPAVGAQILDTITEYPYLSIGAHYHHERYDGLGYPEGISGDDIPEIARIVAVADAYDAMTSKRSYRDPIPQDKVREEIVKGTGMQFDPEYARIMLHLIDVDTEYKMKEMSESSEYEKTNKLTVGRYRSVVSSGKLITSFMTTVRMSISSDDEAAGIAPMPSMILYDALDGKVHSEEKEIRDSLYYEYGEIWFDGRTLTGGARKMQSKVENVGSSDIKHNGDYKIEAVRISDHALIRITGKNQTSEIVVALPDSTRYMYICFTGEHCCISDVKAVKAEKECSPDYIPRIADKISYIDAPEGDIPNVQIDGFRTDSSQGIEIKDGLKISFHAQSLPTARLVWHCPFIDIFCSDDGKVNGKNYRDLAFMRFDGEFWEHDQNCSVILDVEKNEAFGNWDSWKKYNREGYDATVSFGVEGNRITIVTENAGISIRNTAVITGINDTIYAAITGDQVALTNIRHT